MKKTLSILTILIVLSLFVVSCTIEPIGLPKKIPADTGTDENQLGSTHELKKFNSPDEIITFLEENTASSAYYGGGISMGRFAELSVSMGESDMGMAMDSLPMTQSFYGSGKGASDYSETNIQVKGVDEADFIKNDNKYIYILSQGKLIIVDAFPADDAEILSETDISGRPKELFINGNRLVIFSEEDDESYYFPKYSVIPMPRYADNTHAYIYDITDKEEPELITDYEVKGDYFQSRMIGDYVYFIAKENVNHYEHYIDMPFVRSSGDVILNPEVFYFDNPEDNYIFHTIASFDINAEQDDIYAKTFMMGYSNTLYVSKNNIYITYQKNFPYSYYETANKEKFYDIIVPLFPSYMRKEIESIKDNDDLKEYEKWSKISALIETMYNEMDEDEKYDLLDEMMEAVEEYEIKREKELRKTVIHSIRIGDGEIEYGERGEVEGNLLNQFSMDEHDGYFRVATNTNIWAGGDSQVYNNVYVLDDELEIVGKIEDIAPGERIYSTRFIGSRLYMVTFKRIDPLFVIDLSDPKDPEILGELKIPGYSDYLHPYDEDHIIGIGKETDSNEWGGTSVKGVKISLFDVSDVENPKQVDKYEIGEAGSDSEALRDHKAFLFDKEKDILVIPIREVKGNRYFNEKHGYYTQRIWQGAYVLSINPEDGISKKGKITHLEGDEQDRWYWNSPSAVRRSLYMDDVLYTISAKKVKMNDLDDIGEEINEIELPYEDNRYYYGWY